MAGIMQTTFSNVFSGLKMYVCRYNVCCLGPELWVNIGSGNAWDLSGNQSLLSCMTPYIVNRVQQVNSVCRKNNIREVSKPYDYGYDYV